MSQYKGLFGFALLLVASCSNSVAPAQTGLCPAGSNLPPLDYSIRSPRPPSGCRLVGALPTTAIVVKNRRGEVVRDARLVVRDRSGQVRHCPDATHGECDQTPDGTHLAWIAAPELSIEVLAPAPLAAAEYCPSYERYLPNGEGCEPVTYRTTTPVVITLDL
ncbi:MAG: hypothetical protein U0269_14340 [Polyangiales bacterium]